MICLKFPVKLEMPAGISNMATCNDLRWPWIELILMFTDANVIPFETGDEQRNDHVMPHCAHQSYTLKTIVPVETDSLSAFNRTCGGRLASYQSINQSINQFSLFRNIPSIYKLCYHTVMR